MGYEANMPIYLFYPVVSSSHSVFLLRTPSRTTTCFKFHEISVTLFLGRFFFFLLSIYKSIYYNTVYIFKLAEGYTRYNIIYIFFFPVRPSWRCIHIVLYNDKLFILAESTAIYFSVY